MTALLRRGLTTTSAGGFFFIPYLLQLNSHSLLESTGKEKIAGIPKERLALGIIFESLFGYKVGVRSLDSISRTDFGLLSGLPFLPSPSTQYRFLHSFSVNEALSLQVKLGKRLVELEQIKPDGSPVNIDGHNVKTYSRKAMKKSYITQNNSYGKAIRTFYTQDQASNKPLLALATYSGTTVSQITNKLVKNTCEILGQDFIMVADKEWYCGQLIEELHEEFGVDVLVPIKRTRNHIEEFDNIPLHLYEKSIWGKIAIFVL